MKKLIIALCTVFLLSCSKENATLKIESQVDDEATSLLDASGLANQQFAKMGPYEVSTDAIRGDCRGLAGIVQKVLGRVGATNPEVRCSPSFPYEFASRFTTEVHYPSNIASLEKLPVVSFVGGLLSNVGNYDATVKLWASHGFIVVNTGNFINFSPAMHIHALHEIARHNKDLTSPLYNKVDLSRTLLSGHSAGGSAAIEITKVAERRIQEIDADLKIIGCFPLQASFAANSNGVRVPTLLLTGFYDVAVPPFTFPLTRQFQRMTLAPAWYACATNADHLSPVREVSRNQYVGISVAFMRYIANNDEVARSFFVGSNYGLANDSQFVQEGSIHQRTYLFNPLIRRNIAVQRNRLAERL